MLLIPTIVKPSPIAGLGVFTLVDIPAGTLVWELSPFDMVIRPEDLSRMPEHFQHQVIVHHGYLRGVDYILCIDNSRFTNHSYDANLSCAEHDREYAKRDIKAGEELTVDYREFDDAFDPEFHLQRDMAAEMTANIPPT